MRLIQTGHHTGFGNIRFGVFRPGNAAAPRHLDGDFAAQLLIEGDGFFTLRNKQLVALTVHHAIPAIDQGREFPDAGGLMSYGSNLADSFRQVGLYTGRILKGDKPADLPVQQSTKVELVINVTTAKALGLAIPPSVLAIADEVIE